MHTNMLRYKLVLYNLYIIILHSSSQQTPEQDLLESVAKQNPLEDATCHSKYIEGDLPLFRGPKFRSRRLEKTIFFIDASCNGGLNPRQLCHIEAAADANPTWKINVLFVGPVPQACLDQYAPRMPINVYYYRIYASEFAKSTPLESLLRDGHLQSKTPVTHMSYILKFLVLYKYGGLFLSRDTLVIRPFDSLPKNFVVREDEDHMGASAIGMTRNGVGSQFINISVELIRKLYNPENFSEQDIVLKTLQKICFTKDVRQMSDQNCQWMKIFSPRTFYPIAKKDWQLIFDPDAVIHELVFIKSTSHAFTVWYNMSKHTPVMSTSLYAQLAKTYCPNVVFRDFITTKTILKSVSDVPRDFIKTNTILKSVSDVPRDFIKTKTILKIVSDVPAHTKTFDGLRDEFSVPKEFGEALKVPEIPTCF